MVPSLTSLGQYAIDPSRNHGAVSETADRNIAATASSAFAKAAADINSSLAEKNAGQPAALVKAHKDFESLVLKTMLEAMLPDQADNVFGKGIAGETWKSMMAEKLADEVMRSGGIGLAKQLGQTAPVRGNAEGKVFSST